MNWTKYERSFLNSQISFVLCKRKYVNVDTFAYLHNIYFNSVLTIKRFKSGKKVDQLNISAHILSSS